MKKSELMEYSLKDFGDGFLAISTLGASSIVKGVVKSIKKAGEELDE